MNITRVILHQRGVDVEVDDIGLVLVGENLPEERAANFFLHVEHIALAARGIDQDAEGERQVRFRGEVFDGLRLAVFKNVKSSLVRLGISAPCLSLTLKKSPTTLTLNLSVSAGACSSSGFLRRRASGPRALDLRGPWGWKESGPGQSERRPTKLPERIEWIQRPGPGRTFGQRIILNMPGIPLRTFVSLILGVRCTKWPGPGIRQENRMFPWCHGSSKLDGLPVKPERIRERSDGICEYRNGDG